MAGPGGSTAQALRPACRLAVGVAAEGELAAPRIPAPFSKPMEAMALLDPARIAAVIRVMTAATPPERQG